MTPWNINCSNRKFLGIVVAKKILGTQITSVWKSSARAGFWWLLWSLQPASDQLIFHRDAVSEFCNNFQGVREDCYEARLHVREAAPGDQRFYYLAVENDRGRDRHAVHLAVRGNPPTAMNWGTLIEVQSI